MAPVSPLTKTARQAQIAGILTQTRVRSQEDLAERLAERGVRVTQATLSRDLDELGAGRPAAAPPPPGAGPAAPRPAGARRRGGRGRGGAGGRGSGGCSFAPVS